MMFRESGSELRMFLIDYQIGDRDRNLTELNNDDTTPERKRELEKDMMERLHYGGAAEPKTGGQELAMLQNELMDEVAERMRGINIGRHRDIQQPTIDL